MVGVLGSLEAIVKFPVWFPTETRLALTMSEVVPPTLILDDGLVTNSKSVVLLRVAVKPFNAPSPKFEIKIVESEVKLVS
ncbi:MAG: hypothetical protein DDT42_02109 [candidate division WS2 bacterium]|uniref:Uncharacterized protein n=1 Tax=Psychracetigena formicireducens TaxID=2986056 RepID=A0A9E2BJ77_PSYF1|nr:hypothetical protein [Candidatus Psychracetigena formicireducens]